MTDQERHTAIGALVERHQTAKRTRAALIAEIQQARQALESFSRSLHDVSSGVVFTAAQIPRPADYPAADVLAALLRDLTVVCREYESTQRLLKDAGIDTP